MTTSLGKICQDFKGQRHHNNLHHQIKLWTLESPQQLKSRDVSPERAWKLVCEFFFPDLWNTCRKELTLNSNSNFLHILRTLFLALCKMMSHYKVTDTHTHRFYFHCPQPPVHLFWPLLPISSHLSTSMAACVCCASATFQAVLFICPSDSCYTVLTSQFNSLDCVRYSSLNKVKHRAEFQ